MKSISMNVLRVWLGAVVLLLTGAVAAGADGKSSGAAGQGLVTGEMKDVPHPFLLWTPEEAKAIRKRVENDPAAKKQYERMKAYEAGHPKSTNKTIFDLFDYMVMGNEEAGERQKKKLIGFIGTEPEGLRKVGNELKWNRGAPSSGDRHMRDEQTLNVLRYDVLYNDLTPKQRAGVEKSFKAYIDFHLEGHKPWHPDFKYDRTSWLPNMHWPRAIGTHLMTVALKDEDLIKKMFHATGGYKWYMDEYLADGSFYMEEFGKYYSNIGTMLMWCEGLHRLGMDQYGWGYTGTGDGANMKNYLMMFFRIGYPRTDVPGGMPQYPRVTMGDAKGMGGNGIPGQHTILSGYNRAGKGGDRWWSQSRMNGPLPKARAPIWFEVGHRRWPEAGFDYFLAQMRQPGQDKYLPTLYFGLEPIDPDKATPPDVESYLADDRGFAMLRAEETPKYWESEKPAVAMQFGMYYVHYVHDCYSLLGYHAYNRPIYINNWGGGKGGYAGGHAWKDSVRSHAGVVVDNLKAEPVDRGNDGMPNQRTRKHFSDGVKFVAGRAQQIYPDVDLERAIALTDEYLLDLYWLKSDKSRQYDWMVHGPGSHVTESGQNWKATTELDGSMLYRPVGSEQPKDAKKDPNDLTEVKKLQPGKDAWSTTILQDCAFGKAEDSALGKEWYDRKVGVRVTMAGSDAGTTVFTGRPPVRKKHFEWGGQTIMARRKAKETVFLAMHVPYENGPDSARKIKMEKLAEKDNAVLVKITGPDFTDYVGIRYADGFDKKVTLAGGGVSVTFSDFAYIRTGKDGKVQEKAGAVESFKLN